MMMEILLGLSKILSVIPLNSVFNFDEATVSGIMPLVSHVPSDPAPLIQIL